MTSPALAAEFPPGYDPRVTLHPLGHSAWTDPGPSGTDYRRWLTQAEPLYFGLTYLGPYLTDQRTGQISFSRMHMDAYRICAGWAGPGPSRHAVVGWREAGKSTAFNLVGLLWALAHGHARYPFLFSLTDKMVAGKLRRVLALLRGHHECSARLLADFPELALVRSSGGRHELAGGAIIAGHGMLGESLGEVGNESRPDLLLVDDPQPKDGRNTPEWVAKGKAAITSGILPMGKDAHTVLAGTVTMLGDLMDDVVRKANREVPRGPGEGAWLRGFTCRYYPVDWPQQYPYAQIAKERADAMVSPALLRAYALQFEPHLLGTAASASYFPPPGGWVYGSAGLVGQRILVIDEAYSKKKGADSTAFAIMSADHSRQRVCVDHVEARHGLTLPAKNARIHELCKWAATELDGPPVSTVLIEAVRDGEHAVEALGPYPTGTTPKAFPVLRPKAERIELLHKRYVARGVRHRTRFDGFEAQAQAWHPQANGPGVDDMLDAVSAGERFLRTGTATM